MKEALSAGTVTEQLSPGTASFDAFYAAELPGLVALARALAPAHVAEDVAQEAMLVAYRRWSTVSELERPDLWVRRCCSNLAVSQFRRRLVEVRSLTRLSLWASTEAPPLEDATEEFWAAVRRLSPRQGQAVALRYVYDLSVEEVAHTMQCSVGSVKQHLSRGRRNLATELGVAEEEP